VKKVLYILGELDDNDAEWLTSAGTRRPLATGEVLIHQGREIDSLFFVTHGAFAVTSRAARSELARVGAGEVLGEISFVDRRPPTATVTAAEPSEVLAVPRTVLSEKLQEDPAFAARFYRAVAVFLADRLRSTLQQLGREPADQSDDELDLQSLEAVSKAGVRFERILQRLQRV
jgi:CRP/FNR family cyclic AMP-dependent transcriptional regulator